MELSPGEIQSLGERVMALVTRHLTSLPEQQILPDHLDRQTLQALLEEPLPHQPQGVEAALEDFSRKIAANSMRIGHPRFLGWIRTSPLAAAVFAEALAASWNQSVAVWDGAPAATEVELRVIEWLKEMSGYAPQAGGILTSGGSVANFTCLLAARSAADPAAREEGLSGRPPLSLYITDETHYCVLKAAEMMGLGRQYVRRVPTDSQLRMDPYALAKMLAADRKAGLRPMAVAATIGTVNSGACDDLIALGAVCREQGVWLHVDGAYGGLAALVPEKRPLAAGLDQADSLVFDPHKGLFIPFEAGCALVREPSHLRQAFAVQADYLPNTEPEESEGPGSPHHFRDYGPQLSRNFRALKIYLALKIYGVDTIAAEQGRLYTLAAELAQRIHQDQDLELLAPAPLGIVAFRYRGRYPESELNGLNQHIVQRLQQRGRVFLAGTCIRGVYALRACFTSFRTQTEDLEAILEEVHLAGQLG